LVSVYGEGRENVNRCLFIFVIFAPVPHAFDLCDFYSFLAVIKMLNLAHHNTLFRDQKGGTVRSPDPFPSEIGTLLPAFYPLTPFALGMLPSTLE